MSNQQIDEFFSGLLGCYGHPTIRTPNLDRCAAEGMRFTDFYAGASCCTPSRAALLTGRYPFRSGMFRVLFPEDQIGIPADEITIADALHGAGYRTQCIGKWHLGHLPQFRPTRHGFDNYFGLLYSNDMYNEVFPRMGPLQLFRDDDIVESPVNQKTLTERYTAEAIHFIRNSGDHPFFLYLPYTMPHVPLNASVKFTGQSLRGLYGDVIETIDWSVGEIIKSLKDAGLDERTLVIFTSDNGPWLQKGLDGGSAGLLRAGKGSTWDGGIREPMIARWAGHIAAGSVCHEPGTHLDFLPTCLSLAKVTLPSDRPIDGLNITSVLDETAKMPERSIIFGRYGADAIRRGPWKLHLSTQERIGPKVQWVNHDPPLLFNLYEDPSETQNVAQAHPDVIERMKRDVVPFNAGVRQILEQNARPASLSAPQALSP